MIEVRAGAAELRPVGRLGILHYVDAVVREERKEGLESVYDVLVEVAAIIDDDVYVADIRRYAAQELVIVLAALEDAYAFFFHRRFVLNIDAEDIAFGEKCLPHAQRCATAQRVIPATDTDLEKIDVTVAQWKEMVMVMLGVKMAAPFVGAKLLRQPDQAVFVLEMRPVMFHSFFQTVIRMGQVT